MEGHDLADPFVNARFPALEGDRAVVQRQAVEARPVLARKALEPVESAIFVEGGEIGFEREGRVEDSRAAAGIFLRIDRMRRAVGAEEKFGRARGGGDRKSVGWGRSV